MIGAGLANYGKVGGRGTSIYTRWCSPLVRCCLAKSVIARDTFTALEDYPLTTSVRTQRAYRIEDFRTYVSFKGVETMLACDLF